MRKRKERKETIKSTLVVCVCVHGFITSALICWGARWSAMIAKKKSALPTKHNALNTKTITCFL